MTISEMQERKRELGYTFDKISELSGLPIGTVRKVLGGYIKAPRQKTVAALENVLKKSTFQDVIAGFESGMYAGETVLKYSASKKELADGPRTKDGSLTFDSSEYTYDDYLRISGELDRRMELIDGRLYDLAAPSTAHQYALMSIAYQLNSYIKRNGGECIAFMAPLDIKIKKDERNIVQPDVTVVCDRDKIKGKYIEGPTDLAIEILSPSTSKRDMTIKRKLYRESGVREYWMVDLERESVITELLNENVTHLYNMEETVPVGIFEGDCEIDFSEIIEFMKMLERK